MTALQNGDRVRFWAGPQVEGSPLPSNAWIEGTIADAGTCRRYPSNPTIWTRYGAISVLRAKVERV